MYTNIASKQSYLPCSQRLLTPLYSEAALPWGCDLELPPYGEPSNHSVQQCKNCTHINAIKTFFQQTREQRVKDSVNAHIMYEEYYHCMDMNMYVYMYVCKICSRK